MELPRLSIFALLALAAATPRSAQAQANSPMSVTLVVTVPPRLSLRSVRPARVETRSETEIEVVTEIEVSGNTRYRATVHASGHGGQAASSTSGVRVAVRNASGGLEELTPTQAVTTVTDGYRSGRHEVRCVVRSDDPALLQPNRCAFVFEVTSVDGERLLRASAVLDLEDALQIRPRSSDVAVGDRQ